MGWENRDYARDNSGYSGGGFASSWPTAIKYLIIANIAVFVAETMTVRRMSPNEFVDGFVTRDNVVEVYRDLGGIGDPSLAPYEELTEVIKKMVSQFPNRGLLPFISPVEEWFELDSRKVRQGQVWRLITAGFCHDRSSIGHILVNMLVLFWFGSIIESIYGSREFLFFYFAALLTSSLFVVGLDTWTGQNIPAVGASGAVMGVAMLFAIHFPRQIIYLFFVIPLQARWLVVLYTAYDLYPVILTLTGNPQFTGIAHAGHLGGLAFGYIYWQFKINFESMFGQKSSRNTNVRLVPLSESKPTESSRRQDYPPDEDEPAPEVLDELDAAVDTILRKIQTDGPDSLSNEEKQLLAKASDWYREREN